MINFRSISHWSIGFTVHFPMKSSINFPAICQVPRNTWSSASARCQRLAASPWGSRFHPSVSWHIWQFSGAEVLSREFKYININKCIWQKGTYLYIYIYLSLSLSLYLYIYICTYIYSIYIYIFHSYPRDPNIHISLKIHLVSFKQLNIQIHHPKLNYSYRVVPPSKLLYNPPFHYKKTPQQWNWRSSNTNSPNKLSINIHPAYSYYFGYVYQYPIKPVGGVSSPTAGRLVMASPSFSWPKPSPVLPMRRGDHRPGRFSSAVAKRDMIRAWRGSDWGNRENGGIWRMGHLWTKIYRFSEW